MANQRINRILGLILEIQCPRDQFLLFMATLNDVTLIPYILYITTNLFYGGGGGGGRSYEGKPMICHLSLWRLGRLNNGQ